MSNDPFSLIDPYQPTFEADGVRGPEPIASAIETAVGSSLGQGLSFFGFSAKTPSGFKMRGRSVPGLTLEIHRKGCSHTAGLSHSRDVQLSAGVATTIFTDQPEDWETRARDGAQIQLFTVLIDMGWLERADLIPAKKNSLSHLTIGHAPVDLGILSSLPVRETPEAQSPVAKLFCEGVALQLVSRSLDRITSESGPIADASTIRRAQRIRDYIVSVPLDELTIVSAASFLGTSPRQMQRDFLAAFGEGPISYARRFRLVEAAEKITSGSCTVFEAAIEAGYASTGTFSRALFNTTGLRPSQLKRRRK